MAGVDGTRNGWIWAELGHDGALGFSWHTDLRSVVGDLPAAAVIAVDMPIGLPVIGFRRADLDARAFLGRHKVIEANALARTEPRIRELHPEVCFREMAGAPLRYGKHSFDGVVERLGLLSAQGVRSANDRTGRPGGVTSSKST